MASTYDFFISGDHEAGKAFVAHILTGQGFEVTVDPTGSFVAQKGSLQKTVWLGAMAGKNFHVSFLVQFFVDQNGALVARLNRNMGSGVLKGGALGASKTDTVFLDTANVMTAALTDAKVLVGSIWA
jgi:hypothetical protein